MVEQVRQTLERFRVRFDRFFSERSLHEGDRIEQALARARARPDTSTRTRAPRGCARPSSVTTRTACCAARSGELTYFASDIAYHQDKRERGYDQLINLLGADHHGYQGRMHALFGALGDPGQAGADHHAARALRRARRAREDVQAPRRLRDARRAARRHRRGRRALVHARALARHDARPRPRPRARAQPGQPGLLRAVRARAHRRRSCARRGRSASHAPAPRTSAPGSAQLEPAERALVKRLLELPGEVVEIGERRAPHRLTKYAHDVASDFHAFYRDCRVVGAEPAGARGLPARAVRRHPPGHRARARPGRASRRPRACERGRRASTCSPTGCAPRAASPPAALVLLHGRGVDESDLYPLLDALDPEARLLGATPRAPLTLPPGGYHWYIVERVGFPASRDVHGELRAADRVARRARRGGRRAMGADRDRRLLAGRGDGVRAGARHRAARRPPGCSR